MLFARLSDLKSSGNKKAQALVEFALIFPILVMTIMGIFEFGLLIKNYLGLNYTLGKASREALLCRGQSNADLKVLKSLLKNGYSIDTTQLFIIGPNGTNYGPYKLGAGDSVCDINNNPVTSIGTNLFFFNDNGTPENLTDDYAVDPANSSLPSYAKLNVFYTHTMLCAAILGMDSNRSFTGGMSGTFILKLSMMVRLTPE